MSALRAVTPPSTHDPASVQRFVLAAMRDNREEAALPVARAALDRHPRDARLWQVFGLAARNLGDLATASDALVQARSLAPADALIAHGAARARLEAGLPAVDDFARALRLAPGDGSIILGDAAARFAARDVAGAIDAVDEMLRRQPLWIEGHATVVRLRRMAGDSDDLRSYHEAIARAPAATALWQGLLSTLTLAERFAELPPAIAAMRAAIGDVAGLDLFAAIAADETGDHARAGVFFDQLPKSSDVATRIWQVRSAIRRGWIDQAARLACDAVRHPGGHILWPYVALTWRLCGDPRWTWLEGDPAFVQVYDLAAELGDLDGLADTLRGLHVARERPLDQSVRGGTQTDGPLLSRIEPVIFRLREVIRATVGRYIDALPPHDATHPLLSAPRRPIRFAGSWSVRLTDGGRHADHVHPQGWISSALYIALPDSLGGDGRAGWLTLGGSDRLLPDLAPFREIEPKPGRLVLFPSTMWHGTRPFTSGERLTVAFDVARMS